MTTSHSPSHSALLGRRRFMQGAVAVAGASAASSEVGKGVAAPLHVYTRQATPAASPVGAGRYSPTSFTATEFVALNALMARIIPSDDLGPGAVEAGASTFLDRSLQGADAALLPFFQAGLAAIDAAAGTGGIATLSVDAQDEMLAALAANTVPEVPAGFFGALLAYTRIGMVSDPVHGGNIGFVGWDLIGFPGIKLVWTEQEQAFDAAVAPEHKSVADFGGKADD